MSLMERLAKGAQNRPDLRPGGRDPAAAGRHQQKRAPRRTCWPSCRTAFAGGLQRREALLHAGPAHRDRRGRAGHRRSGSPGRCTPGGKAPATRTGACASPCPPPGSCPSPTRPSSGSRRSPRRSIERRVNLLREAIKTKTVTYNWHDSDTSFLEAVLARGDRRMGEGPGDRLAQGGQAGCLGGVFLPGPLAGGL